MPVTDLHKEYKKNLSRWERCRDAVEGEDAIKDGGEKYLPRLEGQQRTIITEGSSRDYLNRNLEADKDYEKYQERAFWYNAAGRTVDGLAGLIFRKEPTIESPEGASEILEDITMGGVSIQEFSEMAVEEVITVARGGILVDYPSIELETDLTVAEKESLRLRPYWSFYRAESITNWRVGRVNHQTVLVEVRLKETVEVPDPDDEFMVQEIEQRRILDLDDAGKYRQRLYRKQKGSDSEWEQFGTDIYPLRAGSNLIKIPFEFIGITPSAVKVQKPPILDLVDVNLSHFRTMADLENGAHWAGSPTPVFIGDFVMEDDDDVKEVRLGSSSGIQLAAGGDAKYLEFTGQGLEALEKRAEKKEQMMAVLGARILAQEKKMVESAETASIHRAGESSVLASIANSVSTVLTRLLKVTMEWAGYSEDVWIKLNTDFLPTPMDAQTLTALLQSWQSGGISKQVLFWNLQKGEIIQASKTFDEHETEIEEEGPPLGAPSGDVLNAG